MGAMNALPRSVPLTYSDLQSMPDDGHRYELIDGVLIVTPAPRHPHQRVGFNLARAMAVAVPAALEVLMAPFDYVVNELTVLQPDVVVARRADLTDRNLPSAPVLAVEVLSPSTRKIDEGTKRLALEAAGVPHYWLVDPDEPSILALELADGSYREAACVVGDGPFEITTPFAFSVNPVDLTR
jgi:Uma2 family endonuclease